MAKLPDDLATIRANLATGLKLIEDMAEGHEHGRDYYEGKVDEVVASVEIAKLLARSAQAHKLNFAAIPVDALFDKVDLQAITSSDAAAKAALEALALENDLDDESDDWHRKAGYYGNYYAIIDPTEETTDGVVTKARVVGSSPLTTVVVYDESDERTPLYAVKRWQAGKHALAVVHYEDGVAKLATKEMKVEAAKAPDYYPDLVDDDPFSWVARHESGGRLLVQHFRVDGKPYGRPVHRNAYGPQDSITKLNATHMGAVDYQGFPQRYALQESGIDVDDDDFDEEFGTDAPGVATDGRTLAAGSTKLKSAPGSAWLLAGVKSVGEFKAADHKPFLEGEEWQVRAMAVTTGTPLFEFDLGGEQPSGEARRRASARINRHAVKVQRTLGQTWENVAATALALLGLNTEVVVNWAPVETETDVEGLALVSAKIKAGVPVAAAFVAAGFDVEVVAEWFPKGDPHVTPELLTVYADALGKLGQAVTLGTISAREVADMLPTILTDAAIEGAPVEAVAVAAKADPAVSAALVLKAKADAFGVLARQGVDPLDAARMVGLPDDFDVIGSPTTVRPTASEAASLEAV